MERYNFGNQLGWGILKWKRVHWYGDMLSGENTLNKWLTNIIVLEMHQVPEKETPPIIGKRCSFDRKRKDGPYKAGMNLNWLKSYKSSNLLLWKYIFKNFPQQQQLVSSSYQRTKPPVKFLNKSCLRSCFSAQPLSKMNTFILCRKRCATTLKQYSLLKILQSLQFILFCARKMIIFQVVVRMSKRLFFLMTLYTSLTRRTWWLM